MRLKISIVFFVRQCYYFHSSHGGLTLFGNSRIMQGRISSPNFGGIFFKGPRKKKKLLPKQNCYKGPLPLPKQKIFQISADQKKRKGHDAGGGPRLPRYMASPPLLEWLADAQRFIRI
jgi:hypothetical protein